MKSTRPTIASALLSASVAFLHVGGVEPAGPFIGTDQRDSALVGVQEWRITEITGTIVDEREGEGLEVMCEDFKNTYSPVLQSEDTFLQRVKRKRAPSLDGISPDLLMLANELGDPDDVDPEDPADVFVFSFAFDNGYHSNRSLDVGIQLVRAELIPGAWSFEWGFWREAGVMGGVRLGAPGGGKSTFRMTGQFNGESHLTGDWSFEENTTMMGLPECNTTAIGSGTWTAERR